MAGQKNRIIHLHIPKTAGTAFKNAVNQMPAGQLRVFPHWDEKKYASVNPDDYDFYSGHIGYSMAKQIGGDIVAIFRNPVDRFLSVYFFWKQIFESGTLANKKTALASKYSLSEFVQIRDEAPMLEEFYNRVTWQVAHGSQLSQRQQMRALGKTEDQIFRMAAENLSGFAVVGTQEQIPSFERMFNKHFGLSISIRKANVTKIRAAIADIDIKTMQRIQEWVYMDIQLYEIASRMSYAKASGNDVR